jgi:hypothetical protein
LHPLPFSMIHFTYAYIGTSKVFRSLGSRVVWSSKVFRSLGSRVVWSSKVFRSPDSRVVLVF